MAGPGAGVRQHHTAADRLDELDREWFLRHAALCDRIALREANGAAADDEAEVAEATAIYLLDHDKTGRELYGGTPYPPGHPAAEADPRGYVRQEYALWSVCTCGDFFANSPCLKHPSA